ncbi:MAG: hypothetical protein LBQ21_07450 [Clostridiales Family XIII bacterium]|jgi:hypothetical protein|nr:hypothetical protein [Clostridiales Family XIII bacterium]
MAGKKADKLIVVEALGVKAKVDPDIFEDWRILKLMRTATNGSDTDKAFAFPDMFDLIFGKDTARIEAALTEADGSLPVEKVSKFFEAVMEQVDVKNS